jgi:AAA ATPase domain
MRLIKVKISGFRRLANDCEVKLDTDPVCIVGPNAAGKSSFLDALVHLNDEEEFQMRDRTRVPQGEPMAPTVQARFALEEADRQHLAGIPEASEVSQFLVVQHEDGSISHYPEPAPQRDTQARKAMQSLLEDLAKSKWLANISQIEPTLEPKPERSTEELLAASLNVASSEKETLGEGVDTLIAFRERLVFLANEKREEDTLKGASQDGSSDLDEEPVWLDWPTLPKKYEVLESNLHALIEREETPRPATLVGQKLEPLVPEFVPFTELARDLGAVYDLGTQEPPEDGAAIHNFLALADTTWGEMLSFMQGGDPGQTEAYQEGVNRLLEQRAALVWEASELRVKVRIDGTTLTILLSMQANDYITFNEP